MLIDVALFGNEEEGKKTGRKGGRENREEREGKRERESGKERKIRESKAEKI